MSDPRSALRLTRRDGWGIVALLAIGAICLAISVKLFPTVFPEATIKFDLDRKQSRVRAEAMLREMNFDVTGYRYGSSFVYDDSAKVFLERELGLAAMNEAVGKTAKIWRWSHRWYKALQKEEYTVEIAPTGEVVKVERLLPDDSPGEQPGVDETMPPGQDLSSSSANRLSEEEARGLAERFLARVHPAGTSDLRYLGATAREWKSRTDRTFTWERVGIDWKGGRYRHKVVVQGDRVGGYEEFVQVPEAWTRDYQQLRSKNTTAGAVDTVFFLLTLLAMIVMIFLRFRGHEIRWRFAVTFALVGAGLAILTSLNSLPQQFYEFDTTRSWGGFVSATVINALLQGLAIGAMILVITAAGETMYRSAYPRKMALPKIFTWQGFRTKEVFFSTLAGLIVTCFFIAYQCIFYRVATSLGAWSPADVPYDDLLNSAFPWAFLLFIGFLPAVSEEFMSRAFSIPFFEKILKSRFLAVILAGFIWGFGHATYPNQPFYIRGLEVGIAGVIIGVLMIRFNLLFALVWHFTVDAFLSGYLLFRSGNPYYILTAAIASGIFVLPFIVALVAYLRTGRFSDPEPLRHQAEPRPVSRGDGRGRARDRSGCGGFLGPGAGGGARRDHDRGTRPAANVCRSGRDDRSTGTDAPGHQQAREARHPGERCAPHGEQHRAPVPHGARPLARRVSRDDRLRPRHVRRIATLHHAAHRPRRAEEDLSRPAARADLDRADVQAPAGGGTTGQGRGHDRTRCRIRAPDRRRGQPARA